MFYFLIYCSPDNPEALINTICLNSMVHFGHKEHTDMLWGDFKKGCYSHHSNNTWFISSECNKQVITQLVRAGEWYLPSPHRYQGRYWVSRPADTR